jgi:hypothetical protein
LWVVLEGRTIAGHVVMPFLTRDAEGFDVNRAYDWRLAEHMAQNSQVRLCQILKAPCPVRSAHGFRERHWDLNSYDPSRKNVLSCVT